MKKTFFLLTTLISVAYIHAQESYYDYLELGEYAVGYTDTVIYDDSIQYEFMDYKGPAPLFVQVWFPFKGKAGKDKMTFGDFRSMEVPKELKQVNHQLELRKDSASIWYHIEKDHVKYKDIKYKSSHQDILKQMKSLASISERKEMDSKRELPVIVYHHGAQGHSDENYIMAEYFASHGFIFISANYHWPVGGKYYGYPIKWGGYNHTSPRSVMKFARSITDSDKLFFIGHSMGGQTGYSFLRTKEDVTAFVCMETTAEGRSEADQLRIWKRMYNTINKDSIEYTLPILHMASLGRTKPFKFWPFTKLHNADIIFTQPKIDFGHESYTSSYLMRYFFKSEFKVPDSRALRKQLDWYVLHLKLIHQYLDAHVKGTEFEYDSNKNFFFSRNK